MILAGVGALSSMIHIEPNWFAYAALLIWPAVALYLYSNLPIGRATVWAILGGYLLLPVGTVIKFEQVPGFDKQSIPNLAALICCILFTGRMPKFFRGFGFAELLIIPLLVSPFITSMLNTDPVRIGEIVLPGLSYYESASAAVGQFIFLLPFFLGREFLQRTEDNADILRILVVAGLAYSLPMLFEVRISPQLHTWIYGYFPHSFLQQIREGGFRPVVFLGHGLLVAFFAMTATVAAAALWRTRTPIRQFTPGALTGYLSVVLVLCKTGSALLYAAILVPLVRWASPRMQLRVACVLAAIVMTYPILRVADLIPTDSLIQLTDTVSAERAASLKTRFDNEKQLMEHAWQRPWFGWGRFGRNRVYDAGGEDVSITDGRWIITLGTFGLIGFFAEFGLIALVVFRAASALRFASTMQEAGYLATLALIVAINMIDLLPNSSLSPWTWLLAGALLGRAEALREVAKQILLREPNAIRESRKPIQAA
jgi:hypothetical protein